MRALLIVLDGVGVGNAPDAANYGDRGADTLGHVFAHKPDCALPTLFSLGLGEILAGHVHEHDATEKKFGASYGRMRECSVGKDTTTGHWEIAGAARAEPFAVFEKFPPQLIEAIEQTAKTEFLGNYARGGMAILDELGEQHCQTGKPILYTSADSVMQIAAHEEVMPPKRLYEICRIARRLCNPHRIGRVIARPFVGKPGKWIRTPRRHDYSIVPPRTVLNAISEAGFVVEGIGKISDVFGRSGVTHSHATASNLDGMQTIERLWRSLHDGLIFANLVDFDSLFGHRRDVEGFAASLMEFDAWLAGFLKQVEKDDLVIITADHGNDPTFRGTDHTREEVPLIVKSDGRTGPLGVRNTFADVAATLARFFHLQEKWPLGEAFFSFTASHRSRHFKLIHGK